MLICKDRERFKVNGVKKYPVGTVGNLNQTMPVIEFPPGLRCEGIQMASIIKAPRSRQSREYRKPRSVSG